MSINRWQLALIIGFTIRGFLLVRGITCQNQDLLDWRIFRSVDFVELLTIGCVTVEI